MPWGYHSGVVLDSLLQGYDPAVYRRILRSFKISTSKLWPGFNATGYITYTVKLFRLSRRSYGVASVANICRGNSVNKVTGCGL